MEYSFIASKALEIVQMDWGNSAETKHVVDPCKLTVKSRF